MNYIKLYEEFVNKFKQQDLSDFDGIVERHHIVPRHDGGQDVDENYVYVTYRQHKFLHKLRWFAYRQDGDRIAYLFMYGLKEENLHLYRSHAGKLGGAKNRESGWISSLGKAQGAITGRWGVESGHLDSIRHLANNEVQREKVRKLGEYNRDSGRLAEALELAWEANRGRKYSQEHKDKLSAIQKESVKNNPTRYEQLKANVASGREKLKEKSRMFWENILINAERNIEFLSKESSRALYKFVSPEGFEFESPIFAAKYYGNGLKGPTIEYWCKVELHGWRRYLRTGEG